MANRVTCITKPQPHSPLEHITHIGGVNGSGGHFYITREEAIAYIESGNYAFHVQVGRDDVPVTVAIRNGVKYLKTRPDHTTRDNLLESRSVPNREGGVADRSLPRDQSDEARRQCRAFPFTADAGPSRERQPA